MRCSAFGSVSFGKPNRAEPNHSERICTWMRIETASAKPRRARTRVGHNALHDVAPDHLMGRWFCTGRF
jgi:hypothetical protein